MRAVINTFDYKKIIKATKKFIENRSKIMEYIRITVKDGILVAEALDGHKISNETVRCCEGADDFECYIKPIPLSYAQSVYTDIELQGDYAYVTCRDFRFGFKQPDGEWYKTDEFFDKTQYEHYRIALSRKLLKDVIDSIESEYVMLNFSNDNTKPMYLTDYKINSDPVSRRILLPIRTN